MTTAPPKLTLKRERFVGFYLKHGNATQAYQQAYNASPEVARRAASRLLTNVDVQQAIAIREQELAEADEATPAAITAELWKLARHGDTSASRVSALRTLADIHGMMSGSQRDLPDATRALIAGFQAGLQQLSQPVSQPAIESSMRVVEETEQAED